MTTALLVDAAMAMANRSLVSMVLVRRGDHDHGAILVRLDHPDGTASLESRVLDIDGEYKWSVVMGDPPVAAAAVEAPPPLTASTIRAMKVVELREALRLRALPETGLKAALVARLLEACADAVRPTGAL